MDDKDYNKYNSIPIPNREEFEENKKNFIKQIKSEVAKKLDYNPFIEIEIKEDNPNINLNSNATSIPNEQPISFYDKDYDEKRTLFHSMRLVGRENKSFTGNNSQEFYYQAKFMEDVEDDYGEQVPFTSYYPYYQQMKYEQLRTYFTWRTQVRKGNITNTSLSYAFLYIYELLNNIGVKSPEEGLNKLMEFWEAFRVYDGVIDKYVLQWIKDYHVYYPMEKTIQEFADEHHLKTYYPTIFGYDSNKQDSFNIYSEISKYKIKKSIFYNEKTQAMINDCFYYILTRLRDVFKEKNMCFEDIIFYPLTNGSAWTPFNSALFYPTYKQQDRQVIISKREVYDCKYNNWIYKTVMISEQGKKLISYIMKKMESSLRNITNFKYKLTANTDMCDSSVLKQLKSLKIVFPKFIDNLVIEFNNISKRTEVKINLNNLNQIRAEALQIQEKLIVPEEPSVKVNELQDIKDKSEENIEIKELEEIKDKEDTKDIMQINITGPELNTINNEDEQPVECAGPWGEFKKALTKTEIEALKIIITGQDKDIKAFAIKNMIMLEVLVDGINEKAMDCIGDTIMELDDTVIIYDDYRNKLIGMVK